MILRTPGSVRVERSPDHSNASVAHHLIPSVADKYKLYKKLSKLGNASRSLPENAIVPPTTPPRSGTPKPETTVSIIPKSRPVKTETASLSNPFSPVKSGQKIAAPLSFSGPANPFATPPKPKPVLSSPNTPSPDPFYPIQTLTDITCPPHHSLPNNTVLRARKRLRGEPVSPSPVKQKRQRVLDSAPKLSTLTAEDSDIDDRAAAEQADSSFVADSPMKPPPKGGAFKLLFEGGAGDVTTQASRVRSQIGPDNTGHGLFFSKSQREGSMSKPSGSDTPSDDHQTYKTKAQEGSSNKESTSSKSRTAKRLYSNRFGKSDRFGGAGQSETGSSKTMLATPTVYMEEGPQGITGAKRSLADTESDAPGALDPNHRPALLPPSPPLAGCSSSYARTGKGKTKKPIHKREKFSEDSGDEDQGGTDLHVKVREWGWQNRKTSHTRDTSTDDLDSILDFNARDRPSSPELVTEDTLGDFEVNLPDDLHRLLAISPSKAHTTRDISMARGVLYGERTSNYDAQRGGDIWDVGEIGEASDPEAEDDWEGEPVPWETGEL
jgi:hypothetical protein